MRASLCSTQIKRHPPTEGIESAAGKRRLLRQQVEVAGDIFAPFDLADTNQLHQVVGFDNHAGDPRVGRHAVSRDVLTAQRVANLPGELPRLSGTKRSAGLRILNERFHCRQTFRTRIDRAAEHLPAATFIGPHHRDEVIQAEKAVGPGRSGNEEFFRSGIDKDVLHRRQAGELLHFFRNAFALVKPGGDFALKAG